MTARIVAEAELEASEAAQWYEAKEPRLGLEFLEELARAFAAIEEKPASFARQEAIRSPKDLRQCILHRFPYVVIFEIRAEESIIWAVAHGRRKPGYWRKRLQP